MALFLVTGGCGFIGSNLVHALVGRGDRVRILDNLRTGRETNIAALRAQHPSQVELWRGDILDSALLDRVLVGVDYILHLAAMPSVPWSIENPLACDQINSQGTLQVLEAARRQGQIRRVVQAVSCAAYGDLAPEVPKRETDPVMPLSPYAASKLSSEQYGQVYSRVYGVPVVALRYFNVFGPRQDPTSQYAAVLPNFINAALDQRAPTIFGDGLQSRDFVFVENVVNANLLACMAPAERVGGQVINIGTGQTTTLLQVLQILSQLTGREIQPLHAPGRSGEVRHSCADISLARQVLGYSPQVDFAEGLRRTLAYYQQIRREAGLDPATSSAAVLAAAQAQAKGSR